MSDSLESAEKNAEHQAILNVYHSCGGVVRGQTRVENSALKSDVVLMASRILLKIKLVGYGMNSEPPVHALGTGADYYRSTWEAVGSALPGESDEHFSVTAQLLLADPRDQNLTPTDSFRDCEAGKLAITIANSHPPTYLYIFNIAADESIRLVFPVTKDRELWRNSGRPGDVNEVLEGVYTFPKDNLKDRPPLVFRYIPVKGRTALTTTAVTEGFQILATKKPLQLTSCLGQRSDSKSSATNCFIEATSLENLTTEADVGTALAEVLRGLRADEVTTTELTYQMLGPVKSCPWN
jgi:hypothetical protein